MQVCRHEVAATTAPVGGVCRDRESARGEWAEELGKVHLLSAREMQVFRLLGEGCSNRSISLELAVSERTVKAHVAQILQKLRVTSRLQAGLVSYAHRLLNESTVLCSCGFR
ncbi:response regulator transcription factor [Streptomyces sp. BBFR2]|uniref:response regulator transcription factor n=1 Tax=Streptomyces sp. BBFR2 TaxID=3372854 RepID=UPI0037D9DB85